MEKSKIKDGVQLKSLQGRLEKEKAERFAYLLQVEDLNRKITECNRRANDLKGQIKELTKDDLVVSEHCILRYLERVELVSIDQVEGKILTEELRRLVGILGGGKFPIGDTGHHVVVKNGICITIE